MFRHTLVALVLPACLAVATAAERHVAVPLGALVVTEGTIPSTAGGGRWRHQRQLPDAFAYATVAGGEAYAYGAANQEWVDQGTAPPVEGIVVRLPDGAAADGLLCLPVEDAARLGRVAFRIPAGADDPAARVTFDQAKAAHYARLRLAALPGAPEFRRREEEARRAAALPVTRRGAGGDESELERTLELLGGGRALSENLQLDRPLAPSVFGGEGVETDRLAGITIGSIDWGPLIAGRQPALDALAACIPADQHAVFFPSFATMTEITDRVDAQGTPLAQLLEGRAEDAGVLARYQRQLCLELSELGRRFGPTLIDSVAVTGGDLSLRTGSDVAVLFQAKPGRATALAAFIASRQVAEEHGDPVEVLAGEVAGIACTTARSQDRRVHSVLAVLGDVVVVTNSAAQLARLAAVRAGTEPALSGLPEYRFFRDRYPLADGGALAVLSDPAIRRWCSARWRIGESRRVRAQSMLLALQAEHLAALAAGTAPAVLAPPGVDVAGLGDLAWGRDGVRSALYGSPLFLTPVAELDLDRVGKAEADAYERWRDGYQAGWSRWFDPIALRIVAGPAGLDADLTVMPLIAGSEYREYIAVAGNAALAPGAGDPHAGVLAHWLMAVDKDSEPVRNLEGMVRAPLGPDAPGRPFSWLGSSLAIYADEDPLWAELAASADVQGVLRARHWRLPIGLRAEVADGVSLSVFLVGLRAAIEQAAPGMSMWETRTHREQPYVRIAPSRAAAPEAQVGDAALYYLASGTQLLFSLDEALIRRAIDRQLAGAPPAVAQPWQGRHLAVRLQREAFSAGGGLFSALDGGAGSDPASRLRRRAWDHLPALNEWKRRFPAADPLALHQRAWGVRPLCPGGGTFTWNERWQTMESTVYGHPGEPKAGPGLPPGLEGIGGVDLGATFEPQGLRTRLVLMPAVKP